MTTQYRTLVWLTLFAIAMAQVEASIVVHLRTIYYPADPRHIFPLVLMSHHHLAIELIRELATVVMLLSVAVLAATGMVRRFAAFVYVFGLWDLFYYIWLKLMIGWPVSLLEWDVLFLIPWPWFGPWPAPALIALVFTAWGSRVLLSSGTIHLRPWPGILFLVGTLLALAAFLLPAFALLPGGEAAFDGYQPDRFLWGLYLIGVLLMTVSLWRISLEN
ncbi:MAG: hypothetical protein LJE73_08705 [Proteobacteria bacterium]|jgi:hypothetical protein|nr:hypothetical protein [Pseudomonadota bacterium]